MIGPELEGKAEFTYSEFHHIIGLASRLAVVKFWALVLAAEKEMGNDLGHELSGDQILFLGSSMARDCAKQVDIEELKRRVREADQGCGQTTDISFLEKEYTRDGRNVYERAYADPATGDSAASAPVKPPGERE